MLSMNYYKILYYKFLVKYVISPSSTNLFEKYKGKKKCIVCLAADYGNLGDVAITYAQYHFLKSILSDYEVVDFPISTTLGNLKSLKKVCSKEDIITIVGGGNMGDLYGDIELLRLMIVRLFPKNRIISFPQTVEYLDIHQNRFLLNMSKKVYNKHKHLLMCARESVSYAKMKELYPNCNLCLVPDIVMTLDKRSEHIRRVPNLITLCLRNDKEKKNTALDEDLLTKQIINLGYNINMRDTHISRSKMSVEERNHELDLIWNDFSRSRIVITDRLHGMIFAYITGTPAIVLPNSNFKIEKCFTWIDNCGYIKFLKEPSNGGVLELIDLPTENINFETTNQSIYKEMQQILHFLEDATW